MGTPATSGSIPAPLFSEIHKFFPLQVCLLLAPPAPAPLLAPFLPLSQADTPEQIGTRNIYLKGLGAQQRPRRPIMQPHVPWAWGPPLGYCWGDPVAANRAVWLEPPMDGEKWGRGQW